MAFIVIYRPYFYYLKYYTLNILLLTNMGVSKDRPASGLFVRRQYQALKNTANETIKFSYYEMSEQALNANTSLIRYGLFLFMFIKRFVFSRYKKDVLHVHFFFPTIILAIMYKFLRNYKVKIIVTFHGNDIYYYEKFNWWYRWCFSFVDHSIFVSKQLKERFYKQNISFDILCAGVLPIYKAENIDKKYDVIFVGTLDKNKGVERLKSLIESSVQNLSVVIVGAGCYQNDILELSRKNSDITYFPHCEAEQLVKLYQQSKWLINLSYNESFGLVISEAMACGLPIIATETDGALSQITHKKNGYIIKQNSDLNHEIYTVLYQTSNVEYKKLSQNSLKCSAVAKLNFVVEKIMNIYVRVCSNEK